MAETFLISDLHLGHENCCTLFKNADGTPLRPFSGAEEMNKMIIENWNKVVRPQDKIYNLGDVVIHKKFLPLIRQLNGHHRLIRGNHDVFQTQMYVDVGFKEIYGVRVLSDIILSHIPLRKECITTRFGTNVHGHLHGNVIADGAYMSVCVEQINYTPISLDELREKIKLNKEKYPTEEQIISKGVD